MSTTANPRPQPTEFAEFYGRYINGVPEGDIVALLRTGGESFANAVSAIPEAKGAFRYEAGKWTVREVLAHLIDAERIFAYRALRIARGDGTPLASFDENAYTLTSNAESRTLKDLAEEFSIVRASTVRLMHSFPSAAWSNEGTASGKTVSVRALAYIIDGHARHHLNLLRERYGV